MHKWKISFWESPNGVCYIANDLLDELTANDPETARRLFKKMDTYMSHPIKDAFSAKYIEKMDGGLYEMRFKVGQEIRYLGCVSYAGVIPVFYALVGFKKKRGNIAGKYLDRAGDRQIEFKNWKK